MKETDIEYKHGIPFYKGMPCFLDGKRLNSDPHINKDGFLTAFYWRDAGLWGIDAVELYQNVFVLTSDYYSWLDLKEVMPMSYDSWRAENNPNGEYLLENNIMEALNCKSINGFHGNVFTHK